MMKFVFRSFLALALVSALVLGLYSMPFGTKKRTTSAVQFSSDTTAYAFINTDPDGTPVTWRTCEPIEVLVETVGMPRGAEDDIQEAVRRIAEASNVKLAYSGTVTGAFSPDWVTESRSEYRGRSPILIGWTPIDSDMPSDETVATSSATVMTLGNDSKITGSVITVHTKRLKNLHPGFPAGNGQGQIYLHELAHSLGLDHVPNSDQLMYQYTNQFNGRLTEGEIEGLNILAELMC